MRQKPCYYFGLKKRGLYWLKLSRSSSAVHSIGVSQKSISTANLKLKYESPNR